MKIRILRGSHEIGGNCVEIESWGYRILVDIGMPLTEVPDPDPILKKLAESRYTAIIISHPHQDHWGLLPHYRKIMGDSTPVYIGKSAWEMLKSATFYSPAGIDIKNVRFISNRKTFRIGDFSITPFLMDHSAFDSYALLIDDGQKRVFYTGDFRGHGRKGKLLDALIKSPPFDVDVLLTEGTMIGPGGESKRTAVSEKDVEKTCAEIFKNTPGMALVAYSSQNIDRMVSIFKAARNSGRRYFVMDLYTAEMARATGRKTIPKPGNKYNGIEVKVFIPKNQRIAILREKAFNKLEWVNSSRIYDNTFGFKEHQNEMVMLYRNSSAFEFEKADCLEEATLIWSLWSGYLRDDPFIWDFIKRHSIKLHQVHCSGHAYVEDIKKLAKALYPCKIVPIHTQAPEAFKQLFGPDVELHLDEEWWRV